MQMFIKTQLYFFLLGRKTFTSKVEKNNQKEAKVECFLLIYIGNL